MQPAINEGDRIIADLTYYTNNEIERGDIVAFSNPKYPERIWAKRIVALGGETIEINNGKVLINGKVPDQNIIKKVNLIFYLNYIWISLHLAIPSFF